MIDIQTFLADWTGALDSEARETVRAFLAPQNAARRYLLGRNENAAVLCDALAIFAIVDDGAAGAMWRGRPVIAAADLPEDAIVINCALSQRPNAAHARLKASRAREILNYADLMRAAPDIVPPPDFVADMRRDMKAAPDRWRALWAAMSDNESRRTLSDVVRYRLTGDPAFMRGYAWRVKEQYFDAVAGVRPNAIFVDAGGYDGDTSEAFCERHPDYRRVHMFEPAANNMEAAKTRLRGRRDIVFHAHGVGAAIGEAHFDAAKGSASTIATGGATRISITTIDQAVAEPVDFIKMDIEGAEWDALNGAARHIEAERPVLALAVYHQARDFWRLHDFAAGLRPDYRAYLRHYTEGWAETVLYMAA